MESSSHRQDRIAGAPCPGLLVRLALHFHVVRTLHTWTNDIQGVLVGLTNNSVEVSIYHRQSRACSPVSKESRLDIIGRNVAFYEDVVLQEDHSWSHSQFHTKNSTSKQWHRTSSDVVCSAPERLNRLELIFGEIVLRLELHSELQNVVGELAGLRRRVGLRDLLSRHVEVCLNLGRREGGMKILGVGDIAKLCMALYTAMAQRLEPEREI